MNSTWGRTHHFLSWVVMTVETILEKEKLLVGAWDDKLPESFRAPFPLPETQATSSGFSG